MHHETRGLFGLRAGRDRFGGVRDKRSVVSFLWSISRGRILERIGHRNVIATNIATGVWIAMRRKFEICLVLAVALGTWSGKARALAASDKEAIRSLSNQAAGEFDQGRYDSALSKFQRAYGIAKVPKERLNGFHVLRQFLFSLRLQHQGTPTPHHAGSA